MKWAKITLSFAAVLCTGTLLVNGLTGSTDGSEGASEDFSGAFEESEGNRIDASADVNDTDDTRTEDAGRMEDTKAAETSGNPGSTGGKRDAAGVMNEYRGFLGMEDIPWNGGERLNTAGLKFMTEDLNGDQIPELLVKSPVDIYGTIGVYSCKKSGMFYVCYGENLGWYYPGTGVFVILSEVSQNGNPIKEHEVYYYMEDISERTEPVKSWSLNTGVHTRYFDGREEQYVWCGVYDEAREEEYAEATQTYISQAEFEDKLAQLTKNVSKTEIGDNWIENTKENRDEYLR